jgi:hypothetical protein
MGISYSESDGGDATTGSFADTKVPLLFRRMLCIKQYYPVSIKKGILSFVKR